MRCVNFSALGAFFTRAICVAHGSELCLSLCAGQELGSGISDSVNRGERRGHWVRHRITSILVLALVLVMHVCSLQLHKAVTMEWGHI